LSATATAPASSATETAPASSATAASPRSSATTKDLANNKNVTIPIFKPVKVNLFPKHLKVAGQNMFYRLNLHSV
jgi:hypothetical protein